MSNSFRVWTVLLGVWLLVYAPLTTLPIPKAEAAYVDEQIEEVYLSLEQALKVVFPDSSEVTSSTHVLTEAQRKQIEAYSKRPLLEPTVTIYEGLTQGKLDGYALVTEEIGMYKPITSVVGITPQGKVKAVAVMVYRESRGGEVKRRRFLSQYRGKNIRHPIRINKDIINVTGATLSVRSMNSQVRRALGIIHALFLQNGS